MVSTYIHLMSIYQLHIYFYYGTDPFKCAYAYIIYFYKV